MPTITISFPVKQESGPPWPYPTMHIAPFNFSFEVDHPPQTKRGAYTAAGFFREKFLAETHALGISTIMQTLRPLDGSRPPWIPSCYLSEPDDISGSIIRVSIDGISLVR